MKNISSFYITPEVNISVGESIELFADIQPHSANQEIRLECDSDCVSCNADKNKLTINGLKSGEVLINVYWQRTDSVKSNIGGNIKVNIKNKDIN